MPAQVIPIFDDSEARERIRRSLDESLIVEAAAGTGKTSELIRRIIYTLESGRTTVDRIVAVTFTNKAAGELKLRLRGELEKRLAEVEGEAATHLQHAASHLEEASISTIHAFCAQILRERPVEACVDPAFEELNELQAAQLRGRAFRWWFEKRLNDHSPALRRALSRMAGDRTPASDQLKYAAADLIEWRDYPAPWVRRDWDREAEIDLLVTRIREASPKISSTFLPVKLAAQWIERHEAVRREAANDRDYDALEALLIRLRAGLRRIKRKGVEDLNFALERFRERADADLAAALREEMLDLVDRYQEIKRRQGKLDFLDLLIQARNLLRDNAEVRGYLQRRYSHVFVDEFQDTDPVQAEFLILLCSADPQEFDWERVTPVAGKLFVVGDPKQSIYKFRRADVVLYERIKSRLQSREVGVTQLTRNFRSVAPIQRFVNASFQEAMRADAEAGQANYIALRDGVREPDTQPSVVALPIPRPYGERYISRQAIEASLPDVVVAYVEWLTKESKWTLRDPSNPALRVKLEEKHICVLFRRFTNYGRDLTREYTRGLEARGIKHLLVGSKSFHKREEVETLRAALAAVEWPEDELSVFATLKGTLFAIPDSALLRWRAEVGRLHPFGKRPESLDADLSPIAAALDQLKELHRLRNRRPAAETVNLLLDATRTHAAFAIRPGGLQVLANVHRVAELARGYEASGGISFRGLVEELENQTLKGEASEAPVMEEGAEGVRLMTVHAAKGLEFPVVILADLTAKLSQEEPDRYVNSERGLCASRLLWCSPVELLDHREEERARERAEGLRVAYVAATRARDLLVVPNVGDAPLGDNWLEPLEKALYPARGTWRDGIAADGCPKFGKQTVLVRPHDLIVAESMMPGRHGDVVWWDPSILKLDIEAESGMKHEDVLVEGSGSETEQQAYEVWRANRAVVQQRGSAASTELLLPSQIHSNVLPPVAIPVEILRLERATGRAGGRRFGVLVHAALRDATSSNVEAVVRLQAKLAGADATEIPLAEAAVREALSHPLLERAARASRTLRETPITARLDDGRILDGVIDLAFLEDEIWTVVDFKTDSDLKHREDRYQAQLGWYAFALSRLTGQSCQGVLLVV